jgi:hypothetical protein
LIGATDVAIQSNRKIVVFAQAPQDFTVAQLLPSGDLDPSFGDAGIARTDVGARENAEALALQSDGAIVGVGWTATDRLASDAAFVGVRYTAGSCSVPNVRNRALPAARRALTAANCRLGSVRRARSKRVRKGRIVSQTPSPGPTLADWASVAVVVSRGRR